MKEYVNVCCPLSISFPFIRCSRYQWVVTRWWAPWPWRPRPRSWRTGWPARSTTSTEQIARPSRCLSREVSGTDDAPFSPFLLPFMFSSLKAFNDQLWRRDLFLNDSEHFMWRQVFCSITFRRIRLSRFLSHPRHHQRWVVKELQLLRSGVSGFLVFTKWRLMHHWRKNEWHHTR